MGCTGSLCFADSLWLADERAFTKKSRNKKSGTSLFGKSCWKVIEALTGEAQMVDAQGCDKDWYLTSQTKYTDTESRHLHLQLTQKIAEISRKVYL